MSRRHNYEVNILESFHFREEIFWRHDPLDVVKENCINHRYRWEYKIDIWEEEEIHQCEDIPMMSSSK
jgi:hypothetical protein